jgi:hypothetical protein
MRLLVSTLALAAVVWPVAVSAQTPLRWKLKPGDAFIVEIEQHTDSLVAFSAKSAETKIVLTLHLGWKVAGSEGDSFTIRQTVERIQERIATPQSGTIEYDSAAAGRPTGQTREIAEAMKPLVDAEFELVMTARGDITSVKPANDSAKALISSTEKGAGADAATQDALQQMLRRPLLVLPEKALTTGDTWSIASERTTAAGALKLETTYRLERPADQDPKRLVTIGISAKATPGSGATVKIVSHEHQGTVLFSADEGRVVEINQTQKLVTERPYRDSTITVTLSSKQTTMLKPIAAADGSGR